MTRHSQYFCLVCLKTSWIFNINSKCTFILDLCLIDSNFYHIFYSYFINLVFVVFCDISMTEGFLCQFIPVYSHKMPSLLKSYFTHHFLKSFLSVFINLHISTSYTYHFFLLHQVSSFKFLFFLCFFSVFSILLFLFSVRKYEQQSPSGLITVL